MKSFLKSYSLAFAVVCILFLLIIAYTNSLYNGFVYDDRAYVEENHHIRSMQHFFSYFTNLQSYQGTGHEGQFKVYRPLVTFSFALDYMIGKLNPFLFHLTNLLLHCGVALLIFFFFYRFSDNMPIAFITALLFAVHPVQVEAVSWISGRGNMLYSVFAVLSLITFLAFLKNPQRKYMLEISVLYFFALLSKEMAFCIIPLLILIYFYRGKTLQKRSFFKLIAVLTILSIIYLIIRFNVIGTVSQGGYWGGSAKTTFFTMITVLIRYTVLLFFPFGLNVLPVIPLVHSIFNPKFICSSIILTAIILTLIFEAKKKNTAFGMWWVYLSLLPVLNIIPLKALFAERFLYLGVAGGMFCVVVLLKRINVRVRIMIYLTISCFFCIGTVMRNADWKSNTALWKSVVRVDPENARAYNGLGVEALETGESTSAHDYFIHALQLNPNNYYTSLNLALTYKMKGDEEHFLKTLDNALDNTEGYRPSALHNIGLFLYEKQEYTAAIHYLEQAVSLDPNYANAYNSLGLCYAFLEREDNAVNAWLTASKLKGGWIEPLYNIIVYYLKTQNQDKAIYYIRYAKQIFPKTDVFLELERSIK